MWPLLIIGVGLWCVLGTPKTDVANWFWKSSAAPWEEVDAYFYPSRSSLSVHQSSTGLKTIGECRVWAARQAAAINDAKIERSDYECGIGRGGNLGSVTIYRITLR